MEAQQQAEIVNVVAVRELTREHARELTGLTFANGANRIHYRQRLIAQLFARGLTDRQIAAATGSASNYIRDLRNKPHMQELILAFQEEVVNEVIEPRQRMREVMLQSLDLLQEKLDAPDAAQMLTTTHLTDIFQKTADRCGFAPVAKSVQVSGKLTRDELQAILAETSE